MNEKKDKPGQPAPMHFIRKTAAAPMPQLSSAGESTPNERVTLNPSTLLAPVPAVMISCAGLPGTENARPNVLTVAWVGTICSEPPMVSVSIRPSRYSHGQISQTREFVINLVDESLLRATDYCGIKTGATLDKFEACALTAVPAAGLEFAPAVAESPLTLSCKVAQVLSLGSHDVFIAEVVAVEARSHLLDDQNKLRIDRAKLVAYAHGDYYALGKMLGFYGYSVASAEVLERRMPQAKAAPVPPPTVQAVAAGYTSRDPDSSRPFRKYVAERPPRREDGASPRPYRKFDSERPPRREDGASPRPYRPYDSERPPRREDGASPRPYRKFDSERPPRREDGASPRPYRKFDSERPPRREDGASPRPYRNDSGSKPYHKPESQHRQDHHHKPDHS